MTHIEAMKQMVSSLERIDLWLKTRYSGIGLVGEEIEALAAGRQAIEQAEKQEPVAIALNTGTKQGVKWLKNVEHGESLYTTPPQRSWVGLTEERIKDIWLKGKDHGDDWLDVLSLARSFEAELKEKNT